MHTYMSLWTIISRDKNRLITFTSNLRWWTRNFSSQLIPHDSLVSDPGPAISIAYQNEAWLWLDWTDMKKKQFYCQNIWKNMKIKLGSHVPAQRKFSFEHVFGDEKVFFSLERIVISFNVFFCSCLLVFREVSLFMKCCNDVRTMHRIKLLLLYIRQNEWAE